MKLKHAFLALCTLAAVALFTAPAAVASTSNDLFFKAIGISQAVDDPIAKFDVAFKSAAIALSVCATIDDPPSDPAPDPAPTPPVGDPPSGPGPGAFCVLDPVPK